MVNKVHLVTYADRLGKGDVSTLYSRLRKSFPGLFAGIHLLPFYYPIDGADAGYDPIDNRVVDKRIGDWQAIKSMASEYELMADIIVNHISNASLEFQDVLQKGESSEYFDLFVTKDKVFGENAKAEDLAKIFRPRPSPPFTTYDFKSGESKEFWTTFSQDQIDIDVQSKLGISYLESILNVFADNGIKSIRLDAVGYAIKIAGTSCFMLAETFEFIDKVVAMAHQKGIEVLTEIHSHYQTQIDIAKHTDRVYDFALPPLLLYSIEKGDLAPFVKWLEIRPENCVTVLDTHDGIGVMDLASSDHLPGLLSDSEIDFLIESIHKNTKGNSRKATGEQASNLDIYQVNSTYYDALARDENKYLLARAIQFFCPGIPQVYYVGWLGLENDMALLSENKVGRDINRSYVAWDEVEQYAQSSMVRKFNKLIHFRNENPAFNGVFSFKNTGAHQLEMTWVNGEDEAILSFDLAKSEWAIVTRNKGSEKRLSL
ncbi:MAG: sucrose phosphorylase [Croceimicrobium sp.]